MAYILSPLPSLYYIATHLAVACSNLALPQTCYTGLNSVVQLLLDQLFQYYPRHACHCQLLYWTLPLQLLVK